jgi:hypothetical protein
MNDGQTRLHASVPTVLSCSSWGTNWAARNAEGNTVEHHNNCAALSGLPNSHQHSDRSAAPSAPTTTSNIESKQAVLLAESDSHPASLPRRCMPHILPSEKRAQPWCFVMLYTVTIKQAPPHPPSNMCSRSGLAIRYCGITSTRACCTCVVLPALPGRYCINRMYHR